MAGIQTNLSISSKQAYVFFNKINENAKQDNEISKWMEIHRRERHISIQTISYEIEHLNLMKTTLQKLRSAIVTYFITASSYSQIMNRIQYYNRIQSITDDKTFAQEPCCSKCFRIVFTASPPPYHTEYRKKDTDYITVTANLLHTIRVKYGYSVRPNQTNDSSLVHSLRLTKSYKYLDDDDNDIDQVVKDLKKSQKHFKGMSSSMSKSLRYTNSKRIMIKTRTLADVRKDIV